MCGIAGLVNFDRRSINRGTLKAMADSIAHRGPDDQGYLTVPASGEVTRSRHVESLADGWLGLAHRRLTILDLSPAGWQPMRLGDTNYYITFNGEIYNYVELRQALQKTGRTFDSHSDTEVLLAAYAEWGVRAFSRLVGMFGCAILDLREKKLVFVRDPFGIKPLYYSESAGRLAFASEIKAVLASGVPSRKVCAQRLYDYLRLAQSDAGEQTFLDDVRQLPAAHYVVVDLEQGVVGSPVRYWDLPREPAREISFADATEELRAQFMDNVRLHMRSDVPVGAALSGGIDSSSIVMAMRHIGGPDQEIHTFSFVPKDESVSEARWMDLVGEKAGVIRHRIQPDADMLLRELDALVTFQDEPFGSIRIYAQHLVYRATQEAGIKVVLDGQGADEQIAGYGKHYPARMASLLRRGDVNAARAFAGNVAASGAMGTRDLWLRAIMDGVPSVLHSLGRRLSGHRTMPAWLQGKWFREQGVITEWSTPAGSDDRLRDLLRQDLTETSLPMLLRWQDRNSMAHSVESRVPFITTALVEKVLSYPERHLITDDGTRKAVFRAAMRGLVPDPILDRQDKVAFVTPELSWLHVLRPWVDDLLQSDTARNLPFFHPAQAKQEWDAALASGKHDWKFWRWISLIKWIEAYDIQCLP